MKKFLPLFALLLLGAGCADVAANNPPPADPHAGWQTVAVGGVVSVQIPPGCTIGAAAGSTYVTCPAAGTGQPQPNMVLSSDGQTVDIRHFQNHPWDKWDDVVSTLKVLEPIDRDVKITIEHN
jgi:hypothetical protein